MSMDVFICHNQRDLSLPLTPSHSDSLNGFRWFTFTTDTGVRRTDWWKLSVMGILSPPLTSSLFDSRNRHRIPSFRVYGA